MNIVWSGQFKKDYKRAKKQNRDLGALRAILETLVGGKSLSAKCRDHNLSGTWKMHRECHITPDWLLIYRVDGNDLILQRMGSHAELFK